MFDAFFGWRKASQCKKLIKRLTCRIKLLNNKRSSIVRQSRDDVIHLLRNGYRQIAFHRVEQLIMDERNVAAYNLIDHFCEFTLLHLPYIRRHKELPNDIKEAVSSLIYASARCGDLPELSLIRKFFSDRYGHKFAIICLQLLPGNLVNHQVKENLSIGSVSDEDRYRMIKEITGIQTGAILAIDNGSWQESKTDVISSEDEDEDVEEIEWWTRENGKCQEQRVFKFKSLLSPLIMEKGRGKKQRRRAVINGGNVSLKDVEYESYYGESFEEKRKFKNRRRKKMANFGGV